jgi:hypothetical protein
MNKPNALQRPSLDAVLLFNLLGIPSCEITRDLRWMFAYVPRAAEWSHLSLLIQSRSAVGIRIETDRIESHK